MASVASLDSDSTSSTASEDLDEEYRLAQQEWEESVEQLNLLVSLVLLPFLGKWLGRRCSQLLFARYTNLGLGKSFWFGNLSFWRRRA
ncbi:hypothetical protein SISSUDRAFT_545026 [Sistotremastrum suecicum HHB10207 ss-3]|uniref:Uncharacterized protein n=1 Tax=Sistotremastrum suecicum HHB10207 ss-3 TaxID=1314776 RepID=A0A166EY68_9AGAM|nr:hypothetical protein SISSUDRAFT_545026 [Sistotremastrum suecicum HHB10207 ss-3]